MWDDEQLLALLKEALQDSQAVPSDFIEAGKNAYAWHGVDDELAQLSYDSDRDRDAMAGCGPRQPRSVRSLSPQPT